MIDCESLDGELHISPETYASLGLSTGKMGGSIYFFRLSRLQNNEKYQEIAEKLLKSVFCEIKSVNNIDFKDGLSGIGIGIHYLVREAYIEGDINEILEDIDNLVFKTLCNPKYCENTDAISLIYLLFYLCVRIKELKKNSESRYLFEELAIDVLNGIYERVDSSFIEEPLHYTIDYPLPLFLFILAKMGDLHFYNYRITKIIDELSPKILSFQPVLCANRLYLLAGMISIKDQFNRIDWENRINFLKNKIAIGKVLEEEIGKKNIYFQTGLSSIYFLLGKLQTVLSEKDYANYRSQIRKRIEMSDAWQLQKLDPNYLERHKGLLNGFPGVIISLDI